MAEQTLEKSTLILKDKELLEKVLGKSISEMGEEEIGIIRARRAYLTPVEKATFAEILEDKISYLEMTGKELIALLDQREIEIPKTATTKAQYVALLEEADIAEVE